MIGRLSPKELHADARGAASHRFADEVGSSGGCDADDETAEYPDPEFVARLREVLQSRIGGRQRSTSEVHRRTQVRCWSLQVLASCDELADMALRASLTDHPGTVLAQVEAAASTLAALGTRSAQLRAELAAPDGAGRQNAMAEPLRSVRPARGPAAREGEVAGEGPDRTAGAPVTDQGEAGISARTACSTSSAHPQDRARPALPWP